MYYDVFEELCRVFKVRPSDVSKATGIATSTLTSWKKGRYTPKAEKLQKIAEYFNVSVDFFYENTKDNLESVQKKRHIEEYYEDARLAQEMFEDPDMRSVFHMKQNMSEEKFQAHIRMMKDLYRLEHPEEEDFN